MRRAAPEWLRKAKAAHLSAALVAFAVLSALPAGAGAADAVDREYAAYLASQCITCHRVDGQAIGGVPAIAGWKPEHFTAVMESYRRKERDNDVMGTIAAELSDAEIAALAGYFGNLVPSPTR